MRNITKEELNKILELHREGEKANLRYADLSGADLRYATLSFANLSYANLIGADLRYADLSGADLSYADLSNVDLRNANLSNVDLRNANLSNANLRYANLRYANLSNANLSNVALWGCVGNGYEVKSLQIEEYPVVYTSDVLQIGCKRFPIEKWFSFSDQEINNLADDALELWKEHKAFIKQLIKKFPATPTKQNNKEN